MDPKHWTVGLLLQYHTVCKRSVDSARSSRLPQETKENFIFGYVLVNFVIHEKYLKNHF
jgi:hypothetical protein